MDTILGNIGEPLRVNDEDNENMGEDSEDESTRITETSRSGDRGILGEGKQQNVYV